MSTSLRVPPGASRPVRARPFVLSPDRITRGLEFARRDPETALRVAVVAHGRLLSALDRRTRGLIWYGRRPRRFLPERSRHLREQSTDYSKIACELATWWHGHKDELSPSWAPRLLATIHAVAVDRWHFPQLSTVSWMAVTGVGFEWASEREAHAANRRTDLPGWVSEQPDDQREYLAQLRDFRADLLDKATRIEKTARRISALRDEVCADDVNRGVCPASSRQRQVRLIRIGTWRASSEPWQAWSRFTVRLARTLRVLHVEASLEC